MQGSNVGTKLYPHQKKALTFLLEREQEIRFPNGKSSSLWKKLHESGNIWQHLITLKEINSKPDECKGALLADDVGHFQR